MLVAYLEPATNLASDLYGRRPPLSPSIITDNNNEERSIERLLRKRIRYIERFKNKLIEYLVRWVGYGLEYDV